jgi:tRNA A37 threonylcarbamoyladenosine modification protein TsaB
MARSLLTIDTQDFEETSLSLNKAVFHKFSTRDLSENLIPEIKKFFKKNKVSFNDLEKIEVRTGSHFSRTRTTIAVANALIFALNLKQKTFQPVYSKEPSITLPK